MEQEFNDSLAIFKSEYAKVSFTQPHDLKDPQFYGNIIEIPEFTFEEEELKQLTELPAPSHINNIRDLADIHKKFNLQLENTEVKPIQKDRIFHKINEEIIYLLLVNRYFKVIARSFARAGQDEITIPLVSTASEMGLIVLPKEVESILGLEKIDYNNYLLGLLRLIDTIVDFTTNAIIRISISSNSSPAFKSQYTIGAINLQLINKLQSGFQLLDLKNDSIRRKYDGLKYNLKKVNGIVYDLSLRNLISTPGAVV